MHNNISYTNTKKTETILIIGNGFDLAHKLPTKYKQFLNFINIFSCIYTCLSLEKQPFNKFFFEDNALCVTDSQNHPATITDNIDEEIVLYLKNFIDDINKKNLDAEKNFWFKLDNLVKISGLYNNNLWIKYFISQINSNENNIGENWIDFESEIKEVISCLESYEQAVLSKKRNLFLNNLNEKEKIIIQILDKIYFPDQLGKLFEGFTNQEQFVFASQKLFSDLENLIMWFNNYLSFFVNTLPKKVVFKNEPTITNPDYVLSFNYTDTHAIFYSQNSPDTRYCFVHGTADKDKRKSIVLGINETLPEEQRNTQTTFITFKKYFQRIVKRTGAEHLNWVELKTNKNIYFLGHSLDVTDIEVIKPFLSLYNKNILNTITIYYHNDSDHKQKIANLVKILGQEETIKACYGTNPQIKFVQAPETQQIT